MDSPDRVRILIADDEAGIRKVLAQVLRENGFQVVQASDGRKALELFEEDPFPLVITDIKMPDMDGLEAAETIRKVLPTPVVIVSAFHDQEFIERALKEHVLAYLIKPLNDKSLKASIELAMQRFREFQALQQETANLEQALKDRKLVERAKGILMQRAELSEPDAFRRLQLLSSQKNQKMVEIARTIVEAEQAFQN